MGYKQYEPETLKKIQRKELEIIKEFSRICEKYEIPYFAVFGTAIGAIRHHGFIPWDDDVDFGMLREDYERFLVAADKEFGDRYGMAGPDCPQKFYNFVSKMYKKGTRFATIYDHGNWDMGINIDIFVFDYMPRDPGKFRRQKRKALLLRSLYMIKNVNFYQSYVFGEGKTLQRLLCGGLHYLMKVFSPGNEWFCRAWKKNAVKYYRKSETVTQFNDTGIWESRIRLEDLFPLQRVPFEDTYITVPKEYDKVLREMYGDYMQIPPKEKQQNHYPYILDLGEGEEKE